MKASEMLQLSTRAILLVGYESTYGQTEAGCHTSYGVYAADTAKYDIAEFGFDPDEAEIISTGKTFKIPEGFGCFSGMDLPILTLDKFTAWRGFEFIMKPSIKIPTDKWETALREAGIIFDHCDQDTANLAFQQTLLES